MSDTPLSLLERLRRDDPCQSDWGRLYGLYDPLLRGWMRRHRIQPADADDLVQKTLKVLLKRLPRFEHNGRQGAFRTWLRTILAFEIRHHFREVARRPTAVDAAALADELESSDGPLARQWDLEHDRHVVARLLAHIKHEFSESTWAAFDAYAVHGRPAEAVAAELKLTVNAVFIARCRVVKRLREEATGLIEDEEPTPTPA